MTSNRPDWDSIGSRLDFSRELGTLDGPLVPEIAV